MTRRSAGAALAALVWLAACARDDAVETAFRAADSLRLNGRFADALPRYAALKDSLLTADSVVRWRAQTGWAETLLRTGKLPEAAAALDVGRGLAGGDSLRLARATCAACCCTVRGSWTPRSWRRAPRSALRKRTATGRSRSTRSACTAPPTR
jgi:hypothetical protein